VTYAGSRRIVDADSHLMEGPDFLSAHADPAVRGRLPPILSRASGLAIRDVAHSAMERGLLRALGDDLIRRGPKWFDALGAADAGERSEALDLLGFERQIVFSSFCATLFAIADPDIRYGAYRAHNRAMAAFCAAERRLLGVALCDLDDPLRARREIEHAHDAGLKLVWLPARAPAGRSPGHSDCDAIWATLAERGMPFVLHVGSGPLPIGDEWMENGRESVEAVKGAEIITAKDFMVVQHAHARFLAAVVLDGVLERHRGLRGGSIEVGAGWVPDLLRRLDHAAAIWSRSEPELRRLLRRPSEQAAAQLRFTPYPFEDVGTLMRESDPRLYLFSSDYPHAEGGRNPLGRFEQSLATTCAADQARFFWSNAAEWLGEGPEE
jgi:predicted TIM-barrel fold metal-dependent hydrolase